MNIYYIRQTALSLHLKVALWIFVGIGAFSRLSHGGELSAPLLYFNISAIVIVSEAIVQHI